MESIKSVNRPTDGLCASAAELLEVEVGTILSEEVWDALIPQLKRAVIQLQEAASALNAERARANAELARANAELARANAEANAELVRANAEVNAELARANAEANAERARAVLAETERDLMNISNVTVSSFTIDVPESVVLDAALVAEVMDRVVILSKDKTTEKSGSIAQSNSIHYFWGWLLTELRARGGGAAGTHMVYEWRIQSALRPVNNFIDIALKPRQRAHLNYIDLIGGLELKNNFTSKSEHSSRRSASASGPVVTKGLPQALSRCAERVLTHWRAANNLGMHRAFCCFADACKMGVARVTLTDAGVVADVWGPVNLPGHKDSTDPVALRVMSWILSTPPAELTQLISTSIFEPGESRGLEGEADRTAAVWQHGAYLGIGGFATVVSDAVDPTCVIKLSDSKQLNNEHTTLTRLALTAPGIVVDVGSERLNGIPALRSTLYEATARAGKMAHLVALKFAPRAIPLRAVLAVRGMDAAELSMFAVALGRSVLSTLYSAHKAGVAHCDVRLVNVMLVSPLKEMEAVVDAVGISPEAEDEAIRALTLSACGFLLNDWGNATALTPANTSKRTKEDLERLVRLLRQLTWVDDVFTIAQKPEGPVALVQAEQSLSLPPELVEDLMKAAENTDYRRLDELIDGIRFV
jgi:hypothetical protein